MKSALDKSWTMTLNCVETSTVLYALQQDAKQPEECLELERIPCIFRSALNQTPRTDVGITSSSEIFAKTTSLVYSCINLMQHSAL
jgi:hypothetical protein